MTALYRLMLLAPLGALAFVGACGPFPGYERYEPPPEERGQQGDKPGHAQGESHDHAGQDAEHDHAHPHSGDEDREHHAHAQPDAQPALSGDQWSRRSQKGIRIVQTGEKGVYYIIDTERRLCFFRSGNAVAPVDCGALPEARELLGDEVAEPERAPAEEPAEDAPIRDESIVDSLPEADPDERDVKKLPPPDLGKAPSADEKRRFTLAYVSIFCAQREGAPIEPARAIEKEGLSMDRYAQIEGWMATDAKVWRALRAAAVASCPAKTPERASR